MEIEKLNKTQIILLTLLTSFVTSIATGIVTVSLLDQAPPGVTQTINRVVERTIEKIVPSPQGNPVLTKETTVVVKEDDLISKSIEKDNLSLVMVFEKTISKENLPITVFVGLGVVLTKDGIIATDSGIISDSGSYLVTTSDQKSFEVKVLNQDEKLGVALIQAVTDDTKYSFIPANLGDADKLRLGQSVIVFGGNERQAVSIGIVSGLTPFERKTEGTTTTESFVGYVDSSIPPLGGSRGGPLANIFGEIVGMNAGEIGTRFVSENILKEKLAALLKSLEKKSP